MRLNSRLNFYVHKKATTHGDQDDLQQENSRGRRQNYGSKHVGMCSSVKNTTNWKPPQKVIPN